MSSTKSKYGQMSIKRMSQHVAIFHTEENKLAELKLARMTAGMCCTCVVNAFKQHTLLRIGWHLHDISIQ